MRARILLTALTYPPARDGVARVVQEHAAGLAEAGFDVTVATGFRSDRGQGSNQSPVRVVHFDVSGSVNPLVGIRGDAGAYKEFVRSERFDAVFCHCWQAWSTDLALQALMGQNSRRVIFSHGVAANSRHGWPWRFPFWVGWRPYVMRTMPRTLAQLHRLVVMSEKADSDRCLDRKIALENAMTAVEVIGNGTDLAACERSSSEFLKAHGIKSKHVLLTVGRFDWLKNEMMVARAVLGAAPEDTTLVLVGPKQNDYSRKIQALWQRWPGRPPTLELKVMAGVADSTIAEAYQAADVLLSGSRTEYLPLVLLDAMGSRTPFVSTNVGCVSELAGGVTVKTEQEMAVAVRSLLESREAREVLGDAGRRACEQRYNWNYVRKRVVALAEAVLDEPLRR